MEKGAKKHVDGVMAKWVGGYFVFVSVVLLFGGLTTAGAQDSNSLVKVLWQKEFVPDPNLGYSLGGIALSKDGDGLLLIGTSFLKKSVKKSAKLSEYTNFKFWLWRITLDGQMSKNIILKDTTAEEPTPSMQRLYTYKIGASEYIRGFTTGSDGNIYVLIRSDVSTLSILKADIEGNNISVKPLAMEGEKFSWLYLYGIMACPDNNFFIFGHEKNRPIVIKLDSELNRMWKRSIEGRRYEYFYRTLPIESKDGLIVSGVSEGSGSSSRDACDGFVMLLDGDGNTLQKARFAALPVSSHKGTPRMCRLDSGIIVVANDLSYYEQEPNIVITAYSPDLKLLWEKRMNKPLKPYTTFRMERISDNRFIIMTEYTGDWLRGGISRLDAAKTDNTFGLHIYDSNGTESGSAAIDKGDFSPSRLYSTKNLLYITSNIYGRRIEIMALQID